MATVVVDNKISNNPTNTLVGVQKPKQVVKGKGKKMTSQKSVIKMAEKMPVVPTTPLPIVASASTNILQSKVKAFESEILSLQADNALLKQDVDDRNDSIRKLKDEIKDERAISNTFKTEAQTLKLSLAEDTQKHDQLKKNYKNTVIELRAVQVKFSEMSNVVDSAKKIKQDHENMINNMKNDFTEKNNIIQRDHAKELGRLKNMYEEKIADLHKGCAATERSCEKEMKLLKEEKNKTELELKDTAVGLAKRCQAYERRIDIQEKEISRLTMNLQLRTKPNVYKEEQSEKTINELKQMNEIQSKQITDMMNKINMINLNKHFDHRDNKWFT